jgi:hypothetical protein
MTSADSPPHPRPGRGMYADVTWGRKFAKKKEERQKIKVKLKLKG